MTEKRFELIKGIKKGTRSGILDNQKGHNRGRGDELWIGEVTDKLNKLEQEKEYWKEWVVNTVVEDKYVWKYKYKVLKEENQAIQDKVWQLIEYLKDEKGIPKQDIKKWWNK